MSSDSLQPWKSYIKTKIAELIKRMKEEVNQ